MAKRDDAATDAATSDTPADAKPAKAKADSSNAPTHFVVTATQARMPDGTYAAEGKIVSADELGEHADIHIRRGALRVATAEEIQSVKNVKELEEA